MSDENHKEKEGGHLCETRLFSMQFGIIAESDYICISVPVNKERHQVARMVE